MKNILIPLAVSGILLFAGRAQAQKGLSLSVTGIPQFSFLENKDNNNNSLYNKKATFNAAFGLGSVYNFTNNMGFGADVLYALQGQKYELSGTEYNQKNNYIKVPVYFSYNSDASRTVSFIGKIGPQVSFLTSSKLDDKDGITYSTNTKEQYKSVTFGGMALAGVQFKLSNILYLTTAARYDHDFTNAEDKNYYGYTSGRAKTYNSAAGLEIGLKYRIK